MVDSKSVTWIPLIHSDLGAKVKRGKMTFRVMTPYQGFRDPISDVGSRLSLMPRAEHFCRLREQGVARRQFLSREI